MMERFIKWLRSRREKKLRERLAFKFGGPVSDLKRLFDYIVTGEGQGIPERNSNSRQE